MGLHCLERRQRLRYNGQPGRQEGSMGQGEDGRRDQKGGHQPGRDQGSARSFDEEVDEELLVKLTPHHRVILLGLLSAALAGGCKVRNTGAAARIDATEVALIRKELGGGETKAAEVATAAEPSGFATIRGSFKLIGSAPERGTLNVNKDQQVCMPGGKSVLKED